MSTAFDHLQTPTFDGAAARRGYPLNAMCFSFNSPVNRARFQQDPEAYFREYGLTESQSQAVRERNVTAMIAEGGTVYYLMKLANMLGMDVQDVGAQQTGMTKDAFRAQLQAAGA